MLKRMDQLMEMAWSSNRVRCSATGLGCHERGEEAWVQGGRAVFVQAEPVEDVPAFYGEAAKRASARLSAFVFPFGLCFRGVVQLSARSNLSEASGSETWEPAGSLKDKV